MDTSKIIKGVVSNGRYTVTAPIVKEDYGLYLQIEGVELPETYQVDFSNSENNGTSVTMIGNADGVLIPRQFIDSGKDVFAFLYHVGADFGRTVYKFRIPNKVRPDRTNEEPTPEEQSVIDQAISALNEAVAQTAQDKADADASAQSASGYAERAEEARTDAQNYASQAEQSATDAHESASQASASAAASAQSASQSAQIKADVEDLADDAQASANASAQSASQASASEQGCARAVLDAASAAAIARARAEEASGYAQTASAKAQDASTSAQTASQKATEASQSASQASGYAQTAESAKTDAQTAKTQAETARDEAVTAKTAAETAQGKAEDAQAAAESVAESIPSDYSQLSEDVSDLKEGFRDLPSIKDVVEEDAELYICDANGKVLAKFADGGFQTENFSTEDLSTKAYRKNTSESSDLDVVDESGGIVLRLKDGQIETKEFSSSELANTINGIIKNIDALDDVDDYSLNNRLANPVYTTNELYNEENPNNPITPVNALYRNMDSFATNGYRIPTIVITNSGTVLVAAQHMKNGGGDFGDFGIHVARKTVNGEWTASEVIPFDTTRQDYGGCLNPEFLVDRNSGRIYLFYGTEKQKVVWWEVTTEDGDFRYVYSDDDGENWSNPVSLKSLWDTEEYDYCIPSCTKGITLTDGTLVVPCFCKKGFDGSTAYSYPLVLYKTVGGDWTFSSVVKAAIKHLDECAVVEGITPNTIWLYCRPNTNYGTGVNRGYNKFVYNISSDTFTQIPTTFDTNRHNCLGIDRITIDGTLIYLMTFTDSHTSKRENITLWASLDGDIWIRVYRILKASGNGYSVIDNHDGQIWVAYESGSAIAVQDVSVLSALISDTASNYIVRNITIQDRMQMIYNALRGIN